MPIFGIGYVHLAVLLGAGAALLGPKELPRVARNAGVLTGRAVGLLLAVKHQASKLAKDAQLEEIQKELHETTRQIETIRSEIRSGFSIGTGRFAGRSSATHDVLHDERSSISERGAVDSLGTEDDAETSSFRSSRATSQGEQPGNTLDDPIFISAKQAGYKMHSRSLPSGADIALDALLEEKVQMDVREALVRMRQQEGWDPEGSQEGASPANKK